MNNLLDLVKSGYFSDDKLENLGQIVDFINKKCSGTPSVCLTSLLEEIDETLNSDYVKTVENQSKLKSEECLEIVKLIDGVIDSINITQLSSECIVQNSSDIMKNIKQKYEEINELESNFSKLEKQEQILEVMSAIQSALILDDMELAAEHLALLIDILRFTPDIPDEKRIILFNNLKKFHTTIVEELSKLFDSYLTDIKWPFVNNGLLVSPNDIDKEKLYIMSDKMSLVQNRLQLIEIPESMKQYVDESDSELIKIDFLNQTKLEPISLPVKLLVRSLVKYFRFYFWTESKVNKISKPEWYLTQVLQWITAHQIAIEHIFPDTSLHTIDVKLEFNRALIIMVMEKVKRDLELTRKDDGLFFHLIEEALTFTVDIRRCFDYPKSYPDLIDVICDSNDIFDHWIDMEQRFALIRLDEIFLSKNAWRPLSSKCRRMECLNMFVGLISAMKERIQCISSVEHQLRFCRVLLEVTENYRLRLIHISKDYNGNSERWYDIMNVVYGVKVILRTWRLDQMFIEIFEYNNQDRIVRNLKESSECVETPKSTRSHSDYSHISNSSYSIYSNKAKSLEDREFNNDSILSNVISLYQHVLDSLETGCISTIFDDISCRAETYINRSWLETDLSFSPKLINLSPAASGMFLVLRDNLHQLHSVLESDLFEHVWQALAHHINNLIFRKIIIVHRFSEFGAHQLDFDIRKCLVPLFSPYSKSPHRFFVDCLESCTLLNVKWGTAVLLKQILEEILHNNGNDNSSSSLSTSASASKPVCPIKALNEIGIFNLSPDVAHVVLNRRVDPNLVTLR